MRAGRVSPDRSDPIGHLTDGFTLGGKTITTAGHKGGHPFSSFLIAMVLAVLVPAGVISGWLVKREQRSLRAQIESQAQFGASGSAVALGNEVRGLSRAFRLVRDLSVDGGLTSQSVQRAMTRVMGADTPIQATLMTQQSVDRLDTATMAAIAQAKTTDDVVISQLNENIVEGQANIITAWLRVGDNQPQPQLLRFSIPIDVLAAAIAPISENNIWMSTITNDQGRILARVPTEAGIFGRKLDPVFWSNVKGGADVLRSEKGWPQPSLHAVASTGSNGWRVITSAPLDKLEAQVTSITQTLALAVLTTGALAIAAVSYLANMLARSISAASRNARNLVTRGEMPEQAGTTQIREVNELTSSLRTTWINLDRQKQDLLQSDHRLRMAQDIGHFAVWEWDRQTDKVAWEFGFDSDKQSAFKEFGTTSEDFFRGVHPDDVEMVRAKSAAVSPDAPDYDVEFRYVMSDGSIRFFRSRGALVEGHSNTAVISGMVSDITQRRFNQKRTRELLREVSHRSKNMLAVIVAMARQTAKSSNSVDSHVETLTRRIAGLAATQDVIVASDWSFVEFTALASSIIQSVAPRHENRFSLTGPVFRIDPKSAENVGIIIAELIIKSASDGALATTGGDIDISFEVDTSGEFEFLWREPVAQTNSGNSIKRDVDLRIARRVADQALGMRVDVNENADHFEWRMRGPIANLQNDITNKMIKIDAADTPTLGGPPGKAS